MPLAAVAGISAGGSIIGGLLGANASGKAAQAQSQAAEYAANLQAQEAQQALGFEETIFGQQQANQAPWLEGGASAEANLLNLMGIEPSTFANTPVPGSQPVQFPQFTFNPNSPNATITGPQPASSNSFSPALNPAFGSPEAQLMVPPSGDQASQSPDSALSTVPLSSLVGSDNSGQLAGNGFEGGPVASHTPPETISSAGGPSGPPISPLLAGVDPSGFSAVLASPGQSTGADAGGVAAGNSSATPGGTVSLSSLVNPSLGSSGSLMSPWPFQFQAPTDVTEANDPGFQFRLQQGEDALQNSAAARGGLLSGGTAKAMERYAQDYSSNEYQNVYNRSLTDYQQAYNQFQQTQANQFNRLAAIAGVGQTSAGQLNSTAGAAGNNVSSILLGTGAQIGQDVQNAAAARASGYVGAANAYSNMFSGLGGLAAGLYNGFE